MKLNTVSKTATWLTIALFAPLAVLSSGGQVLCVGDGNHLQVEPSHDSYCSSEPPHLGTSELGGGNQGQSDCGDCIDVDLDQVSFMRVLSRSADVPNLAACAGLIWSVTATPSSNFKGKQACLEEYSPVFTQPQLSVFAAILIC
jgi:hypothetical protein